MPLRCVGADVVLFEELGEMLVGGAAYAFSFQAEEDCFAGVGGEEGIACLEDGGEVLWACETDGEGAVDEVQILLGRVGGVHGLHPNVKEANPVSKLGCDVDDLTAHGRQSAVVSVRVVGSGDADGGERESVWKSGHPICVVEGVVSMDRQMSGWSRGVEECCIRCRRTR